MSPHYALLCVLALGGCTDSPPSSVRWSYVHAAIIEPSCATAGCHSRLTAAAGVDLASKEGAYVILTGRVCDAPEQPIEAARNYVTPGSSEYSQLVYQLRGEGRDPMPPDQPLPRAEVELVARWIDEGARCD